MPPPFPGMDPFIESQMWEPFHTNFIVGIQDVLVPRLRPKYGVIVEKRIYLESHGEGSNDKTSVLPDVGVVETGIHTTAVDSPSAIAVAEPTICQIPLPEERRETRLVIRELESNDVVTVLELLSPTNKLRRADGRRIYLEKRMELLQSVSHFVELDLIRSGERMPFRNAPAGDYFALVSRRPRRPNAEVYSWLLEQQMPTIPIPLSSDDPDATIDLQAIFNTVYDRAGYDLTLDYNRPVSPQLAGERQQWLESMLSGAAPS